MFSTFIKKKSKLLLGLAILALCLSSLAVANLLDTKDQPLIAKASELTDNTGKWVESSLNSSWIAKSLVEKDAVIYGLINSGADNTSGVYKFDENSNSWQFVIKDPVDKLRAFGLARGSDNNLYVGSNDKLFRLNLSTVPSYTQMAAVPTGKGIGSASGSGGREIVATNNGQLIFYNVGGGAAYLMIYQISSNSWTVSPNLPVGSTPHIALQNNQIFVGFAFGTYNIGGSSGPWTNTIFELKNGVWQDITGDLNLKNRIGSNGGILNSLDNSPNQQTLISSTEQGVFKYLGNNQWKLIAPHWGEFPATITDTYIYTNTNPITKKELSGTKWYSPSNQDSNGCKMTTFRSLYIFESQNLIFADTESDACAGGLRSLRAMRQDPNLAAQDTNFEVLTSGFLGGSGNDAVTSTAIQSDKTVVLAGKIDPSSQNFNQTATTLSLNGISGTTGAILRLNSDGKSLKSISRIGANIEDMDLAKSNDKIGIIGDLGAGLFSSDATQILWNKSLSDLGGSGTVSKKIAVSKSGIVATLLHNQDLGQSSSNSIRVFDSNGNALPLALNPTDKKINDLVLDEDKGLLIITGFAQVDPNLQTPFVRAYNYNSASTAPIWKTYDYSFSQVNGQNLGADSRGLGLNIGEDGKLYFIGSLDGGTSVFAREDQNNISQTANHNVIYDAFNDLMNTSAGKYTYYARINQANGQVELGQFALVRKGDFGGNSVNPKSITADKDGNVYLAADAAYQVQGRELISVSGQPVGTYNGDGVLYVISPDFKSRKNVVSWQKGGKNAMSSIAFRDGLGVIAGNSSEGDLIQVNPLQSGRNSGAEIFYSVWGDPATSSQTLASRAVVLNEISISSSKSTTDQWLELYNNTDQTVDLSNFVIENLGSTSTPNVVLNSQICSNLNIPARGYFLISKLTKASDQSNLNIDSDCILANKMELIVSEKLILKGKNGELVDESRGGS